MRLAGRVAIVTGAASGIGRATAELFAREGARVALVDLDGEGLASLVGVVSEAGGAARAHRVDAAEDHAAERTVAAVAGEWGQVDALVTCAAVSIGGDALTTTPDVWDRTFRVNVRGTFLWMRAVLPAMIVRRRGSIVAVASQLAMAGGRGNVSYIAGKGAVISLVRTVALEQAANGIRVNALVPGAIETPFLERSFARAADPEGSRRERRARHPMGRFGTPGEVAQAALFLASDDSSFTTGSLLTVDGGWLVG
jgi:NAD(P)-dependent dehydrogenase (short-subunit alcohol dehydrogenase family)